MSSPRTLQVLQILDASAEPLDVPSILRALGLEANRKNRSPMSGTMSYLEGLGVVRSVDGGPLIRYERVPGVEYNPRARKASTREYRKRTRSEMPGGSPMMLTAMRVALRFRGRPPTIRELVAEFHMSPSTARRWIATWRYVREKDPLPPTTDLLPRPKTLAPKL